MFLCSGALCLATMLGVTVAYQLFFFFIAWGFKLDKIRDFAGGTNFILVAVLSLVGSGNYWDRKFLITIMQCVWALRLTAFLLYRQLRYGVSRRKKKKEGQKIEREEFRDYAWIWGAQALWICIASLPVVIVNLEIKDKPINSGDWCGLVIWTAGISLETVTDCQKLAWKSRRCAGDPAWCALGTWKYSRHPNYFGEVVLWWGLAISAAMGFSGWQYIGLISPIFITVFILFVSGIPVIEKSYYTRYHTDPVYMNYRAMTSPFYPLPNEWWKNRSPRTKQWLLEIDYFNLPADLKGPMAMDSPHNGNIANKGKQPQQQRNRQQKGGMEYDKRLHPTRAPTRQGSLFLEQDVKGCPSTGYLANLSTFRGHDDIDSSSAPTTTNISSNTTSGEVIELQHQRVGGMEYDKRSDPFIVARLHPTRAPTRHGSISLAKDVKGCKSSGMLTNLSPFGGYDDIEGSSAPPTTNLCSDATSGRNVEDRIEPRIVFDTGRDASADTHVKHSDTRVRKHVDTHGKHADTHVKHSGTRVGKHTDTTGNASGINVESVEPQIDEGIDHQHQKGEMEYDIKLHPTRAPTRHGSIALAKDVKGARSGPIGLLTNLSPFGGYDDIEGSSARE